LTTWGILVAISGNKTNLRRSGEEAVGVQMALFMSGGSLCAAIKMGTGTIEIVMKDFVDAMLADVFGGENFSQSTVTWSRRGAMSVGRRKSKIKRCLGRRRDGLTLTRLNDEVVGVIRECVKEDVARTSDGMVFMAERMDAIIIVGVKQGVIVDVKDRSRFKRGGMIFRWVRRFRGEVRGFIERCSGAGGGQGRVSKTV
jgi:hypothetical protein